MTALDVVYHAQCIARFYNKRASIETKKKRSSDAQVKDINNIHSTALSKVISFIEETLECPGNEKAIFKLSDLKKNSIMNVLKAKVNALCICIHLDLQREYCSFSPILKPITANMELNYV